MLFDSFEDGATAVRALAQTRPLPDELPPARPRRGRAHRRRPGRAGRCSCWASRQPTTRSRRPDGAGARAVPRPRRRARARSAASRRAPGATPSCRRPTCATRSSPAGILAETFETAITWDRFEGFVREVREATGGPPGRQGRVTCRLTHAYPDGAAPYFTVLAPARRGEELEQWDEIKAAASEAIIGRRRHHHPPPRGRPRPPALV